MAEEAIVVSEKLAKADQEAEKNFPIGTDVAVRQTNEWGVVRGHIVEPVLGMEPRTEPVLDVEHGHQMSHLYKVSEVKPYDGPKLPPEVRAKMGLK